MMFHGKKHRVQNNTNCNREFEKGIFDDPVKRLLELEPAFIIHAASFTTRAVPVWKIICKEGSVAMKEPVAALTRQLNFKVDVKVASAETHWKFRHVDRVYCFAFPFVTQGKLLEVLT